MTMRRISARVGRAQRLLPRTVDDFNVELFIFLAASVLVTGLVINLSCTVCHFPTIVMNSAIGTPHWTCS